MVSPTPAEWAARAIRGILVGAVAAVLLLYAIVVVNDLADLSRGTGGTPQVIQAQTIHFEGTVNWFTVLGAALWGFAVPSFRAGRRLAWTGAILRGLGAFIVLYVVFYAFDNPEDWTPEPVNGRPLWTIGLAAVGGVAEFLRAAIHDRLFAPRQQEAVPPSPRSVY